jgi:hypothetical protein
MPVLEHEVHALVRAKDGDVYGCWGRRAFADGYYAPDRRYVEGSEGFEPVIVYLDHRMSTECRYDMSLTDVKCAQCNHRGSGEAYVAHVKLLGK